VAGGDQASQIRCNGCPLFGTLEWLLWCGSFLVTRKSEREQVGWIQQRSNIDGKARSACCIVGKIIRMKV